MSTYEWRKVEWTCDECKQKVMMPDRTADIPDGWFTVSDLRRTVGACTSSKPKNHFCSPGCFTKFINSFK